MRFAAAETEGMAKIFPPCDGTLAASETLAAVDDVKRTNAA
jgi:hypothetical protein